jgi:hypothetical protein
MIDVFDRYTSRMTISMLLYIEPVCMLSDLLVVFKTTNIRCTILYEPVSYAYAYLYQVKSEIFDICDKPYFIDYLVFISLTQQILLI